MPKKKESEFERRLSAPDALIKLILYGALILSFATLGYAISLAMGAQP